MHFIFYKTNDVFVAEEKLKGHNIITEVIPNPVQDKAYCGICVKIKDGDLDQAKTVLASMDYQLVK